MKTCLQYRTCALEHTNIHKLTIHTYDIHVTKHKQPEETVIKALYLQSETASTNLKSETGSKMRKVLPECPHGDRGE